MDQKRLNNVAILHLYHELADKIDIGKLMDEFIFRNAKRTNVFALFKDVRLTE